MGIFNLNFFGVNKKNESINNIKKEEEEIDLNSNLICDDAYILIQIGMWLGAFSNYEMNEIEKENFSSPLSVDDLIQKTKISKKTIKKIKDGFYSLFGDLNINQNSIFKITRINNIINEDKYLDICNAFNISYGKDIYSFDCNVEGQDISVVLLYSLILPGIVIIKNKEIQYRMYYSYNLDLNLISSHSYYPSNGNLVRNVCSQERVLFDIKNGKYLLCIDISSNEMINKEEFRQRVSELVVPFDIKDVFKIIDDCSSHNINNISYIKIDSYECLDENNKSNIYSIFLKKGYLESLTANVSSKNGNDKRVVLDGISNWTVTSNKIEMNMKDGKFNYKIENGDYDDISKLALIESQFLEALDAVGEAKKMFDCIPKEKINKRI